LKVDNLSRERMCVGSEFHVDGAETENAREVMLLHREAKKGCHPNHGYNFVNS